MLLYIDPSSKPLDADIIANIVPSDVAVFFPVDTYTLPEPKVREFDLCSAKIARDGRMVQAWITSRRCLSSTIITMVNRATW